MTTEPQPLPRPPKTKRAGRFVIRALLTVVGVIVGLFLYFVCQGVFAGYPRYHTDMLSVLGMVLIALTGGVAWIIDERRIDDDG
jgi:ABC-type tungstate transport system substrate-binding protein